jgi:Acyl-CoA dehydrogenases
MDFDLSGRSEAWLEKLQAFFDQEVLPRHRAWLVHVAKGEAAPSWATFNARRGRSRAVESRPSRTVRRRARHPAFQSRICAAGGNHGPAVLGAEVFNCQAPDVPNMIALQNCATPEQKARWLQPLLEAKTRSAFGMTEPMWLHPMPPTSPRAWSATATTTSSTDGNGSSPARRTRNAAS